MTIFEKLEGPLVLILLGTAVVTAGGIAIVLRKKPQMAKYGVFVFFATLGLLAWWCAWPAGAKTAMHAYALVVIIAVVALMLEQRVLYGVVCVVVTVAALAFFGKQLFRAVNAKHEGAVTQSETTETTEELVRKEDVQAATKAATEEALREVQSRGGSAPIQITEVVPGKAWRFVLCGTDIGTAAAEVRTQKPETTIRVKAGHTYRFSAAGVPAGTVHLTSLHVRGDPEVKDLRVRSYDVPRGYAFLPSRDSIATVWVQGTRGPVELTLTETSESPAAVRRTSSYFQQSSATGY